MKLTFSPEKLKEKKYLYPILLGLFFVIILLNNINWLSLDKSIPRGDHAGHIGYSYQYYHALQKGNFKFFFLNEHKNYPPLTYFITSLFRLTAGDGDDTAEFSLAPFWLILIFSTYFLGKKLWNEDVGIIAGIASFSYPFIISLSQSYLLDLPCSAMIALSLVCLFYSDAFEKPGWTMAFFIALAIAMQIKWAALFCVTTPAFIFFILFLWKTYREKQSFPLTVISVIVIAILFISGMVYNFHHLIPFMNKGGKLTHFYLIQMLIFLVPLVIISFLPFKDKIQKRFLQGLLLFIILIWNFYGININTLVDFAGVQKRLAVTVGDTASPQKMFVQYLEYFQGIIRVALLFIGILLFISDKPKSRDKYIFFTGFAGSVLVLFLIPIKDIRYLTYLTPFIAIITTYWMTAVKWKFVRYPIIVLFFILSLLGIAGWRVEGHEKISTLSRIFLRHEQIVAQAPDTRNWKNDEIARKMYDYSRDENTIFFFIMTGEYADKIASDFMIPFYGKYDSGFFNFINNIRGEQAFESNHNEKRFFRFVLSPIRGENNNPAYTKLLILNFRDKKEEPTNPSEDLQLTENLQKRGFTGKMNLLETVDLPMNSELNYIYMKVEPGIHLTEIEKKQ